MKHKRLVNNLTLVSIVCGLFSATVLAGEPQWIWVSENANVEAPAEQVWFRKIFEIGEPAMVLGKYPDMAPWQSGLDRRQIKTVTAKAGTPRAGGSLTFQNGDRITLLGGTSIERMQTFGYFETLVTSSYPHLNLQFRNLGWSGDDVFGIARAVFGNQADGFRRLEQDLIATDPTVILICYGANESFDGAAGVPKFLAGLANLVDVLRDTGATLVLISPSQLEDLGAPLPDPAKQNERLRLYAAFLQEFAQERGIAFVDFYSPVGDEAVSQGARPAIRDRLTDNGLHWNAYGYWRTGFELAAKLGVQRSVWNVNVHVHEKSFDATGTLISKFGIGDTVEFTSTDENLPHCPPPRGSPRIAELVAPHDRLQVTGLAPGYWGLQIDDHPAVLATAEQWATGVLINRGIYLDQAERLREAIRQKNELFFHRYRPQNETYLFLFRKHEQGNNAVEVPQFDQLVAEKELEIAQLRKPIAHNYRLVPVEKPEPENEPEDEPGEEPASESEN